ncbi:MAG: hypothetical protein CR954_00330 [Candidatus Moraniibacteriota bacterium]|nr:MAG: hypothetical protein CR954_00330 [Candidatus Moranbacteria bacterium]
MPKIKTAFVLLVFAEFVYNISGYVINMGLGRMLGVADYGRYSLVIGVTTMMIILVGRGVPTAMAKRISEHLNDWQMIDAIKHTAARIQILIITLLTVIFYFSAPLLAYGFGDTTLTPLFRLSAFIIPAFALSSFHVLYFNGLKRFTVLTVLKMSRGAFRMLWILGCATLFALHGALYGAILAPLSVFCVALIIESFFLKKTASAQPAQKTTYPWKKILSFAGGFMLFLLFSEVYTRLDVYVIKIITHSDYDTGLYNAAYTIALMPYYVMYALTFILFPTISDLTKNNKITQIKTVLKKIILFLFATLIPAAIVLAFFPTVLTTLFFGPQFFAAAPLIPLMAGATVFATVFAVLASVFNGAGKTHIPTIITCIALVGAVIANATFLPVYGIRATAIIFSSTATFMGLAALAMAYKTFFTHTNKSDKEKVLK